MGDKCVLSQYTSCLVCPGPFYGLYIKIHAYQRGIKEDQGFLLWVDQINNLDTIYILRSINKAQYMETSDVLLWLFLDT